MRRCSHKRDDYMPGTIFRIYIPPGAVVNLLNLIEVASPKGISLVVRLPILAGSSAYGGLFDSVRQVGGMIAPMGTGYYPASSYPGYTNCEYYG